MQPEWLGCRKIGLPSKGLQIIIHRSMPLHNECSVKPGRCSTGPGSFCSIWGPRGCTGQVVITINISPQDAARGFSSVTLVARTSCDDCVDFENHAPILILRQPKAPFAVLWAQAKHYD